MPAWHVRVPPDQQMSKGVVRRVWRFTRHYRPLLAFFLVTIVAGAVIAVIPPLLIRSLIDRAIPERSLRLVDLIALGAVAVALAGAGITLVQRWLSALIGEGLIYDLRVALYDHVQRQPIAFFTHARTGALMSRLNNDVIGAQQALTGTLGSVTSNVVGLFTALATMLLLSWKITLAALLVLPVFVLPARSVGRRLQTITRESMRLNASMNTMMSERFNVAGALVVLLFGRPNRELQQFSQQAGGVRDIGVRSAIYGRTFFVALGLVGAVGTALVYWLGARMVLDGTLALGTVVALGALLGQVYQPLTALSSAQIDIMTAFVSFDRVFEVLDFPPAVADAPDAVTLDSPRGAVEFRHVDFAYPPPLASVPESLAELGAGAAVGGGPAAAGGAAEPVANGQAPGNGSSPTLVPPPANSPAPVREAATVLHDVTFHIDPGELVALVGPTGAGKTTTAMLLARIYDVTAGAIEVDGIDVRALTLESLHAAIGVVTQDAHLFHDTILANLRYAAPSATNEQIEAACRAARIDRLIESLPDGYQTVVGERGYRLSGGEKQRLAIARLLLADPRIVILDEATAHLDSETEAEIQLALDAALAGRTSLVIAHRLSTIVRADRILVIDGGRLVEQGTHAELLARGGLYADLYAKQYGGRDGGAGEPTAPAAPSGDGAGELEGVTPPRLA